MLFFSSTVLLFLVYVKQHLSFTTQGWRNSFQLDRKMRSYDSAHEDRIESAKSYLVKACNIKNSVNPTTVLESLIFLERALPKLRAAKNETIVKGNEIRLQDLHGPWRLIFTTGTTRIKKQVGSINYFPVKAVQTFDTHSMRITNGIYLKDYPLIRFIGSFGWNEKLSKLEFNFDGIRLFGLLVRFPRVEENKTTGRANPFFKWIIVNSEIAAARGGGGGLAVWKRVTDSYSIEDTHFNGDK